jgi:hypothetical protein
MIKLNKIEKFQLFCLENYKTTKNISGKSALHTFERKHVFNFLAIGYEVLHTQSSNYIIEEIIDFIERRK